MVEGGRAAELVDGPEAVFQRLGGIVEELQFVGRPGGAAFGAGTTMFSVLSSWPVSFRKSRIRPSCWSVCDKNPANTSISRTARRRASGDRDSHSGTSGSWRDSSASAGMTPSSFCRANTRSR